MRTDILILILGMMLVTYIPRMLPAVLLEKLHFGPKAEKFLQLVPYTAMAALIFPGILTMDAARRPRGRRGGRPSCVEACAGHRLCAGGRRSGSCALCIAAVNFSARCNQPQKTASLWSEGHNTASRKGGRRYETMFGLDPCAGEPLLACRMCRRHTERNARAGDGGFSGYKGNAACRAGASADGAAAQFRGL